MNNTTTFTIPTNKVDIKENISFIYDALVKKGYDPVNQLMGYILSEDPTYITTYNKARIMIRKIDRDDFLRELVESYIKNELNISDSHE